MIPLTLAQVAAAVGGHVADADATEATVVVRGNPFVDSRAVQAAGLFVAVQGDVVDGHDYAAEAIAAGAAAALVERRVGVPAVVVDDTVKALGRLAQHVVGRLSGPVVVGITGSQGKTGTKDVLAQLLEASGPTVSPTGSFNTEIGVPLTALRADAATEYLVLELGARGRGHISYLTSLVRPRVGVVLNVGVAHLGEFGSRDDIAATKGELVEALPADGVAVLNADDERVAAMRERTAARVLTFGRSPAADVRVQDLRLDTEGCPQFTLRWSGGACQVDLRLVGEHQAGNAAAAATAAAAAGMPMDRVAALLSTVRPRARWRMEVSTTPAGVTVINDAYNANPDSMRAALQTLAQIAAARAVPPRTFAVLGEMRELGTSAAREHEAIGRLTAQLGITLLVAVGATAGDLLEGAASHPSWRGESVEVADPAGAVAFLDGRLAPGDVLLVKASRAAGLETVAAAVLATPTEGER